MMLAVWAWQGVSLRDFSSFCRISRHFVEKIFFISDFPQIVLLTSLFIAADRTAAPVLF